MNEQIKDKKNELDQEKDYKRGKHSWQQWRALILQNKGRLNFAVKLTILMIFSYRKGSEQDTLMPFLISQPFFCRFFKQTRNRLLYKSTQPYCRWGDYTRPKSRRNRYNIS